MSGLQDFLTPFSHLVFANRDKVIVLLAALLAWFTIQLLVSRWRTERLERDLAAAKTAGPSAGGRRYATSIPVDEPPVETGVLPPVKGGRTYARNLGNALQKAGIGSQQIYSPPAPAGWAPNSNPAQPGMGQAGAGTPPYAPQNVPWAAPAPQQGSPWGYPAGAGRGMPGPPPSPGPFYQPQPPPPPLQPMSPQPPMMPAGAPGLYPPPAAPAFGPPAFQPATSGPAAPAPSFAPPSPPSAPPMAPGFGGIPPPVEPPAADPSTGDAGRRGKPKRRRFNFNVLENLEKMVQLKPSEPLPPTGWTPPVTPPVSTALPPAPVAPPPLAAPAPPVAAIPPTPEPTATIHPAPPTAETVAPAKEATVEEESLPLRFGPAVEPEVEVEAVAETDNAAVEEKEQELSTVTEAEAPVAEPEPEPEPVPEPKREARPSMRSMLFGEEAAPKDDEQPAFEPVASEPEPVLAEPPVAESVPEAEPVAEAPEPEAWRPWSSARDSEPESEPELVPITGHDQRPTADGPGTPPVEADDRPSAGTVVIIEDDATAASYYATLFRGNGYHVEVANDGVSGVDLCTRTQPQLILLDVMMPRQNGILVLQTLRATDETKNTPVVVMSNFSEPTLIKRAIQLGALEYVIKTQVEGPALLNALPRWINHEKAFAAA
jgi:CheY-like chemotaxis protein